MDTIIRDATAADSEIIADFNSKLAEETEEKRLDPASITAGVKAVLADSRKGRYWLAMVDGEIAGQIMVTYEWSDWRNGMLWWIQSVYVHPEHRRRGLFSTMYRHVESMANADAEACGIRLYVERQNSRAQATYLSLGMSETEYLVMESVFQTGKGAGKC